MSFPINNTYGNRKTGEQNEKNSQQQHQLLEANLTLEDLKDAQRLDAGFDAFADNVARPILTGLNYLNLYFWLDPRYTSPTLMQIGVRNLQQDGNITIVKGFTYTSEEITDPYEWDGFDQKLISYTKSVVIGGQPVGVIGSDMYIGELQNRLLEESFLEKGRYALLNGDLNFLIHPDGHGGKAGNRFIPGSTGPASISCGTPPGATGSLPPSQRGKPLWPVSAGWRTAGSS